jgi:hypothetical protein
MGPPGDGQALQAGVQRRPSDLYRVLSHILILALGVALAFVAKKRRGRSRTSAIDTSEGKDGESKDSGKPEISRLGAVCPRTDSPSIEALQSEGNATPAESSYTDSLLEDNILEISTKDIA